MTFLSCCLLRANLSVLCEGLDVNTNFNNFDIFEHFGDIFEHFGDILANYFDPSSACIRSKQFNTFFPPLYFRANLSIVRDLDDRAAQGRACGNLGNTHYLLGTFDIAIKYHLEVGLDFLNCRHF